MPPSRALSRVRAPVRSSAGTVATVGQAAAFFDLDRTVVPGTSSTELTLALVEAGLAPSRSVPGLGLLGQAYEHFGENLLVMGLARAAALAARGWPVDRVEAAAAMAAERLAERVAPYLPDLLDQHRRDGVRTVLATTTPQHLIGRFAERIGFDDVIATRYRVADGRFTGALDGPFVWSLGKAAAVRRWAKAEGVDLAASFAYSDSVYDVPLLAAVGHPYAVNPDLRLRAVALTRRWPTLWLDVPPGVPKFAGLEPFDLVRAVSHPTLLPFARFDIAGQEHIPDAARRWWSPTTAATSTRWRSASPWPAPAGRCGSSARRRCSTSR